MNLFDLMRGPTRHMKLIGQHPSHKELRARNESRLAKLKAERRLTEAKESNVNTATPSRDFFTGECATDDYYGARNVTHAELAQSICARYGPNADCNAISAERSDCIDLEYDWRRGSQ